MASTLQNLFQQQITNMRKQELISMLQCKLCEGLYRFAHTVVDCGHTFCQLCILTYIKTFKGKNPIIKCPQCHAPIDQNYRRSVIKDVFKQSLVDMVAPQYVEEDNLIVKRVQRLFPDFDLQFLMDEFKFCTFQVPVKGKKKAQEKTKIMNGLHEKVKEKLGISFENFTELIVKDQNFLTFANIIEKNLSPIKKVQIKPKTERDYQYVGISNQMKLNNLTLIKIKRFLEKKALDKVSKTEDVPKEWIHPQQDKLDIQIFLSSGMGCLRLDDNLQEFVESDSGPIFYSLNEE